MSRHVLAVVAATSVVVVVGQVPGQQAASAGAVATTPRCLGMPATIVGSPENDKLVGTAGRDVIVGLSGDDTVHGRGGADLLCGGPGLDGIDGGAGDDRLSGGRDLRYEDEGTVVLVGDDLWGGPGDDRITAGTDPRDAGEVVRDRVRWDRSSRPVHVDLRSGEATGEGVDRFTARRVRVVGSDGDDVVVGSDRPDWVLTGDGSDRVSGRRGADVIWTDYAPGKGPDGEDVASGGLGHDQVYGEHGDDRLFGGDGRDQVVDYGRSVDQVAGGPGRDLVGDQLLAEAGHALVPWVRGGEGPDSVTLFSRFVNPDGGAGPPSSATLDLAGGALTYTDPDDQVTMTVTGTEFLDLLTWGTSWEIQGTAGDDMVCAGGSEGAEFHALKGDDAFSGSPAHDVFDGGPGQDVYFTPSLGDDEYVDVEGTTQGLCGDYDDLARPRGGVIRSGR